MNELPKTRQSLLLQLHQRSNDAWAEFLQVYEKAIYNFCRRRGLQDADAQDVTQDVLTAVDRRVGTWDSNPSKGTFRGWMFRVARNIAVNKFLERSRQAAASGDTIVAQMLAELPDSEDAQSTAFWMEYRRGLMHWAAKRVKPDVSEFAWKSFWKTAIEGKKADEVAQELGKSVGNVYTAKCRVFARIKNLISQMDDDCPTDVDVSAKGLPPKFNLDGEF